MQTDINIKLSTEEQQEIPRHPSHQPSKGTMLELLSYPNMRRKFYILTFLWLANSVAYNGLSYNSSNLGVSDTLAFFINAIVEAPAYVLTWWAMSRWGRRWVTCLTMLLGGLACCCCMLVPEGKRNHFAYSLVDFITMYRHDVYNYGRIASFQKYFLSFAVFGHIFLTRFASFLTEF